MSFEKMLLEMVEQEAGNANGFTTRQNVPHLKEAFAVFSQENTFKPGDIVEWKPGMINKRTVGPFVVVRVFDKPLFAENSPGTPIWREPLDLAVGVIDPSDGSFLVYHIDKRRVQHTAEQE